MAATPTATANKNPHKRDGFREKPDVSGAFKAVGAAGKSVTLLIVSFQIG